MGDMELNPLENIYKSFLSILNNVTIKYVSNAEKYETMESKMEADEYLDAINKKDTFLTHNDYKKIDYINVGITDPKIIKEASKGNIDVVPSIYRNALLEIHRKRVTDNFEERNDYYRILNGYPTLDDTDFFYITKTLANEYDIDNGIPIHLIQDHYNKIEDGKGDYLISVIEGSGYIDKLIEAHPDKIYLKYLGSNRIDIYTARSAKNFQIIQIKETDVKQAVMDIFTSTYEKCREYFVKTIYVYSYHNIIEYYDNLIAMCIMIMTVQQIVTKQIPLGIKREFFDIYAVKSLYEAYNIPFNINIDEDTQRVIVQNLNLLIQNKATDKVIFNIANLIGFTNIKLYKYYLTKSRKYDTFGVPIIKFTTRFNTDTGEYETVPDYEAMYDIYFQKADIENDNINEIFRDVTNRVEYQEVVKDDPYWIQDQHVYDRLWETSYNFVESKYLSLGVSYSMTDIVFENIYFLKTILSNEDAISSITIKLPKILGNIAIPLFDVIIALLCLTAAKHKLYGEIISIPSQVCHVLDYIKNKEYGDTNLDVLKFNFNYFFNPSENEDTDEVAKMKNELIDYMANEDKYPTNTMGFNFDYLNKSDPEFLNRLYAMKDILGEDDFNTFKKYVDMLNPKSSATSSEKIQALNNMFKGIKNLHTLLTFCMTKCTDRSKYEAIKELYNTLYYSNEVSDVFTITGELTGFKRTAWTYFEFLYHKNPKLYNELFTVDLDKEYDKYLNDHHILKSDYSYEDFLKDIEYGKIFILYDTVKDVEEGDETVRDQKLYTVIDHILARLSMLVDDLDFMYLMNSSSTPLEELLLKLVRFFKSYTVDIVGLDTIFICDFKSANLLKLYDEIYHMEKTDLISDKMRMKYADVIHNITAEFMVKDKKMLIDKLSMIALLIIDNKYGNNNSVKLIDEIYEISKIININELSLETLFSKDVIDNIEKSIEIDSDKVIFKEVISMIANLQLEEKNALTLKDDVSLSSKTSVKDRFKVYDVAHSITTNLTIEESIKLSDKIYKMWYSD